MGTVEAIAAMGWGMVEAIAAMGWAMEVMS